MRRVWLVYLITIPLAVTSSVRAWGYDGHRRINYRAAHILSGQFGKFLTKHADALALYGPIPDFNKSTDPNEFPRHFIDADLYADYPFNSVPRDYDSLLVKYGQTDVRQWGTAPWAIEETCDRIIKFLRQGRFEEAVYFMGVLGHYVSDLHMPLHTIENYNGQLTGNDGIHFRWEVRLVDDYVTTIAGSGSNGDIQDPLGTAFKIVRESYAKHNRILDADTKARAKLTPAQAKRLDSYDILSFEKEYLDTLYLETQDILYDRLGKAVTSIAAYWLYCYNTAGSPNLPEK